MIACHGSAKQNSGNENPGHRCEKQGVQSRKVLCCRSLTGHLPEHRNGHELPQRDGQAVKRHLADGRGLRVVDEVQRPLQRVRVLKPKAVVGEAGVR